MIPSISIGKPVSLQSDAVAGVRIRHVAGLAKTDVALSEIDLTGTYAANPAFEPVP